MQESVGLKRKVNARIRAANRVSTLGFPEGAITDLQKIQEGFLERMKSLRYGPKIQ